MDFGCEYANNQSSSPAFYKDTGTTNNMINDMVGNELTSDLGLVDTGSPNLTFNISTATATDPNLTSGNTSTVFATSFTEKVSILYDYTTSAAPAVPEPNTSAMTGAALIGLRLLGKRFLKK